MGYLMEAISSSSQYECIAMGSSPIDDVVVALDSPLAGLGSTADDDAPGMPGTSSTMSPISTHSDFARSSSPPTLTASEAAE
ncbi:hypothetical protein EV182_008267, partial [Spiromyces aspiralis]